MLFKENKKRECLENSELEKKERKPAWFDSQTSKVKVNIDSGPSRLRKLKQTEKEKKINGQEYSNRLKE